MGFGSLGASVAPPGQDGDLDGANGALAVDLLAGGSPGKGIAVGGALLLDSAHSVDFEDQSSVIGSSNVRSTLLGVFIDGFPNPRRGFHLGGMLGFASAHLNRKSVAGFNDTKGGGLAVWLGYDAWVSEQWCMGGLLRLTGTRSGADVAGDRVTVATSSIAIMLTGLYH